MNNNATSSSLSSRSQLQRLQGVKSISFYLIEELHIGGRPTYTAISREPCMRIEGWSVLKFYVLESLRSTYDGQGEYQKIYQAHDSVTLVMLLDSLNRCLALTLVIRFHPTSRSLHNIFASICIWPPEITKDLTCTSQASNV